MYYSKDCNHIIRILEYSFPTSAITRMFPFESCQKKILQQQQQQQQQQHFVHRVVSFGNLTLRFPTSTSREPASRSASLQNLG